MELRFSQSVDYKFTLFFGLFRNSYPTFEVGRVNEQVQQEVKLQQKFKELVFRG